MDIKNKNTLYWVIGLGVVGYIIWKYRKAKQSPKAVAGNLALAQSYYDKIQQLYGEALKGSRSNTPGNLPPAILDKVVQYEIEIEKQGFTVVNNQLVKATKT